ncbi:MAG: hypothetical protein WA175_13315 [Candidatus Acidiferrales bacterium]
MKTIFSVHAGEYLTGSRIETQFRHVNLWLPAKDTGIDLLVSDRTNRRTVSLQVKFSKDYLVAHMKKKPPEFQRKLRACGWWTLNNDKMSNSRADYWVLVLQGFYNASEDYVVIPPKELAERLRRVHDGKPTPKVWQVYLWVTKTEQCWETRDLSKDDKLLVARDNFSDPNRNFKKYLNEWEAVAGLDRS